MNLNDNSYTTDINSCSEPLFSPGKVIVSENIYHVSQEDEDFTDKMVICLFNHSCNNSELTDNKTKYENMINIKDNKGAVLNNYLIDGIEYVFVTYLHPSFKEPCLQKLFGNRDDVGDVITTHVMSKAEY